MTSTRSCSLGFECGRPLSLVDFLPSSTEMRTENILGPFEQVVTVSIERNRQQRNMSTVEETRVPLRSKRQGHNHRGHSDPNVGPTSRQPVSANATENLE